MLIFLGFFLISPVRLLLCTSPSVTDTLFDDSFLCCFASTFRVCLVTCACKYVFLIVNVRLVSVLCSIMVYFMMCCEQIYVILSVSLTYLLGASCSINSLSLSFSLSLFYLFDEWLLWPFFFRIVFTVFITELY